jgi:uncharacterized cofD-like protein
MQSLKTWLKDKPNIYRTIVQWFTPGLGVKRWLVLVLAGTMIISIGAADILLDLLRSDPNAWWTNIIYYLALLFLPPLLRVFLFGTLGIGMVIAGIFKLNQVLLEPFLRPGVQVVDALSSYQRLEKGPKIVVIGGGTGQAMILSGLKKYSHNITAIVTVADDGGSSGRIRESKGILPPGDIRNCLAALSNDGDLITQLFQYRFSSEESELGGHSFGNLFISALSEIIGSFEEAVAESGRVLSIKGQVLPATLHNVKLIADKSLPFIGEQVRIHGESSIPKVKGKVKQVWLEPDSPPAFPAALKAILKADLIVIGPGSLYTSILPNLLVPDIASAVKASKALKIFVCNVTTQPGETDGYNCVDHVEAIHEHTSSELFDLIISNKITKGRLPENIEWVTTKEQSKAEYSIYQTDVSDDLSPGRHNPNKLAKTIMDLYQERTGPLVI